MSSATVASPWLSEVRVLDWATIRKWKDPEATGPNMPGVKYAGTYPSHYKGAWKRRRPLQEIVDADCEVFYVEGQAPSRWADSLSDVILVELSTTRAAKFLRLMPDAKPAKDEVEKRMRAWWNALTDDQRAGLRHRPRHFSSYERRKTAHEWCALDPDRVADEEMTEFIRDCEHYDRDLHAEFDQREDDLPADVLKDAARVTAPFVEDQYPLMDVSHPEHCYLYIAAVVAANNEERS